MKYEKQLLGTSRMDSGHPGTERETNEAAGADSDSASAALSGD